MGYKQQVPEGVQDYLAAECYNKRIVEEKIRERFLLCGYDEIETPMFEYCDVFANGIGSIRQEKMIKFFDQQGRILALRPDITMPIARMAATKLADFPQRLFYIGNAFGYDNSVHGVQKEFTQAGVECIGIPGVAADAEMIALAIQSLLNAGLDNFQIDIGQVEFFKGLMEEADLNREESETLREALDRKDMLGMELVLRDKPLSSGLKERIMQLAMLYGGEEVLGEAYDFSAHPRCRSAVEHLKRVYALLEAFSLSQYVSIDFGMIKSIDYYTGVIFRGITDDLGYPLLAGGRYDTLMGSFGREACAIGFAIGLKRVLVALQRQGRLSELPLLDAVVGGVSEAEVFSHMERLRAQKKRVASAFGLDANALSRYACGRAKQAVYVDEHGCVTVCAPQQQEGTE
jgi:ATP phosphoribosyltransferase regulatory subunit